MRNEGWKGSLFGLGEDDDQRGDQPGIGLLRAALARRHNEDRLTLAQVARLGLEARQSFLAAQLLEQFRRQLADVAHLVESRVRLGGADLHGLVRLELHINVRVLDNEQVALRLLHLADEIEHLLLTLDRVGIAQDLRLALEPLALLLSKVRNGLCVRFEAADRDAQRQEARRSADALQRAGHTAKRDQLRLRLWVGLRINLRRRLLRVLVAVRPNRARRQQHDEPAGASELSHDGPSFPPRERWVRD